MRMRRRQVLIAGIVAVVSVAAGISLYLASRPPLAAEAKAASYAARGERRAYAGAPPVIPHRPLGSACTACHAATDRELPGIGLAPANPHLHTAGMSESSRCLQCHVFQKTTDLLVASDFQPLRRQPRSGARAFPQSPPILPHRLFMREDCTACHAGLAGPSEIACGHPERLRCLQCHALGVAAAP